MDGDEKQIVPLSVAILLGMLVVLALVCSSIYII